MESEKYKKDFKKGFKFGLLFLFVLFSLKTCSKVVNDKWEEEYSIYDIQHEIQDGRVPLTIHRFALWLGFSDDSWILSPLVAHNEKLYQSGIEKIPETDGERTRLWDQYKYWSYRGNMEKYSDRIIPEIIKWFDFLSKAESKSPHFRDIEQYYIALHMVYDFFRYRNFSSVSLRDRNQTMVVMTDWLMKKCNNLDMNPFLKIRITNGMFVVPLDCQRWSIKYMEYVYKNGMMCDRVSMSTIDEQYKKMQKMAETYYIPIYIGKSQPGILDDVDYMLKHYEENRNKIINSPEHCKE